MQIMDLSYRLKGTSCLQATQSVNMRPVRSGPSKLAHWRSSWRTCWRLSGTMTLLISASSCRRTEALPQPRKCWSCCWTGRMKGRVLNPGSWGGSVSRALGKLGGRWEERLAKKANLGNEGMQRVNYMVCFQGKEISVKKFIKAGYGGTCF